MKDDAHLTPDALTIARYSVETLLKFRVLMTPGELLAATAAGGS
jgi:hypothetical protein